MTQWEKITLANFIELQSNILDDIHRHASSLDDSVMETIILDSDDYKVAVARYSTASTIFYQLTGERWDTVSKKYKNRFTP